MKKKVFLVLSCALFGCRAPHDTHVDAQPLAQGREAHDMGEPSSSPSSAHDAGSLINESDAATMTAAPGPLYYGRFDRSDKKGVRFAWSASTITFRFRGTGLNARFKDTGFNWFDLIVDGKTMPPFGSGAAKDVFNLAHGLPEGVHTVTIVKRSEARVGTVQLLGVDVEDGILLPPPSPSPRRIEFLGDSITAGYGNEGPNASCPFTPREENANQTYAAMTARDLSADHTNISWSGKTVREMTTLWERTLPEDPKSVWNHSQLIPDVVVINLGTNDFYFRDPGQRVLTANMLNLLSKVRAKYPNVWIFWVLGPMLTDAYPAGEQHLTLARDHMKNALDTLKDAGGGDRVVFVEVPTEDPTTGLGCRSHPNISTHRQVADRLVPVIKEHTGW